MNLGVVRLVAPRVPVLGPIADEQQEARRRQALDQPVEEGLRFAVHPVKVLHDQDQRLHLALAHDQRLQSFLRAVTPLGGIECLPPRIVRRRVEQGEQRRQQRREHGIERRGSVPQTLLRISAGPSRSARSK